MRFDVPMVFAPGAVPLSDPDSIDVKLKIHPIQSILAHQRMPRDEGLSYVISETRILQSAENLIQLLRRVLMGVVFQE